MNWTAGLNQVNLITPNQHHQGLESQLQANIKQFPHPLLSFSCTIHLFLYKPLASAYILPPWFFCCQQKFTQTAICLSTDHIQIWIYLGLWYKFPPKGQIVPNLPFLWVVRFNLNSSVHLYIWCSKIVLKLSWITRKSTKASWKHIFDPQFSDYVQILKILLEIQRDIFIYIISSLLYAKSWHRNWREQAEPQLTSHFLWLFFSK